MRILTWEVKGVASQDYLGPRYYMDADYKPLAIRIHAGKAPTDDDAEFDILVDNSTILEDRTVDPGRRTDRAYTYTATTTVVLSKGDNYEIDAEDFSPDAVIEQGSWVWCKPIKDGAGRDFSIHLVLEELSESDEEPE